MDLHDLERDRGSLKNALERIARVPVITLSISSDALYPAYQQEELKEAINQAGGDSWACACSAQRCRSETLGSYFLLPIDVQIEYLPFLADWFIERHRDQIDEIRNTITEWE